MIFRGKEKGVEKSSSTSVQEDSLPLFSLFDLKNTNSIHFCDIGRSDRYRNSWNQASSGRESRDLDRLVFFEKI